MANNNSKNDLGFLGIEFQYRLINSFIEHPNFFKDMYRVIDQNMFTNQYLRTIVGIIKDYYNKHDTIPSYEMINYEIRYMGHSEDDLVFFMETLDTLKTQTTEGIDEIESMAEKFFKQQNWVRVANEILNITSSGDMSRYDELERLVEEAVSVGRRDHEAKSPLSNIDNDLSDDNVVSIPTGISKLDEVLVGGLDKGKVGLIIGPSGFGKTTITTCMAANAAVTLTMDNNYRGYRTLQIVFEDDNRDINRKYMSKMSQVETCMLNESKETTERVREIIHTHPDKDLIDNNIRVLKLDTGEKTASDIRDIIKKKINEGFRPDIVVIDYFECLECERGYKSLPIYEQEGRTMRKFENMAKELDVAIWLPTQANREACNAEKVGLSNVGGSYKKIQIAQVVISINKTDEESRNNIATIEVLKNRSGRAQVTINGVTFNNGTCTITTDDTPDFSNILSYNDYKENNPSGHGHGPNTSNVYDQMP